MKPPEPSIGEIDWRLKQQRLTDWWNGKGCALWITAPADEPWLELPEPTPPADLLQRWTDPAFRVQQSLHWLSRTYHGGAAFPYLDTMIGPGSLGLFLGCEPEFGETTVWYRPCIEDPDTTPPVRFDPKNRWWQVHLALIEEAVAQASSLCHPHKVAQASSLCNSPKVAQASSLCSLPDVAQASSLCNSPKVAQASSLCNSPESAQASSLCYIPVGMPDMIENWDTLAQLRDPMDLLLDSMDRPEWVLSQIEAINQAFFETFDLIYERIKVPSSPLSTAKGEERGAMSGDRNAVGAPHSSNAAGKASSDIHHSSFQASGNVFAAFSLWGPGKTAKVQCDAGSMLSPEHFRKFVQPALTSQCEWLDYSMFHLDGTDCFPILDAVLEIEPLQAVEWTPQPQYPKGGSPEWYDLYRRIRSAGKSVQAIWVQPDEVLPLLDALGTEGMYLMVECATEREARKLEKQVYGTT